VQKQQLFKNFPKNIHGKNGFVKLSKNLARLKIILLNYQNNYIECLSIDNAAKILTF